jgi:REase_DpnII-MboI
MRADDPPKRMVKQIAEDASLYLVAGSPYDRMIPFIWDDSRRTEHDEEMLRGLRQIAGVFDAVIVSRPGSMTLPSLAGITIKPNSKNRKSANK